MRKIVFVLPDMPGGGTERVVALLANEYVKMGYPVAIILFAGNQCAYQLDKRIEVYIAGEESKGKPWIRIKRLLNMRKYYKQNKGCCIMAYSVMGAVFSRISAAGLSCKLIVSERSNPEKYEHPGIRNWAYAKAEKIFLQTADVKDYFPSSLHGKMVIIPNPLSPQIKERFEGERRHRIVSVGRLEPVKNHRMLIHAFNDFHSMHSDYELFIFGAGQLEQDLKTLVTELGLDKSVIFKGFVTDVIEQIWDSKIFVLSSDYEGISNAMLEALAVGVPVIATDCPVGGSRTYIKNEYNGLLIPVGNREMLTNAMKRLAEDNALAESVSINGAKIKEEYSATRVADMILREIGMVE